MAKHLSAKGKAKAKGTAKASAKAKAKSSARPKAMAKAMVKAKAKSAATPRTLPGSFGSVAPSSGLSGKAQVYKDGKVKYDVDLNKSDDSKNMNKFYRMQVLESKDRSQYWFVQHWGRIGTSGQTQVKGPSNKEAILKAFGQKFRQKAGVSFENREAAAPGSTAVTGKYELTKRLKAAGAKFAKLKGSVQISLMWDNRTARKNDLDLHVTTPKKETIFYMKKRSSCGGRLDVDRRMDCLDPVENIVWTQKAPKGQYSVKVVNFMSNHKAAVPFEVGIAKDGGEMQIIKKVVDGKQGASVLVKTFRYA